MVAGRGRRNFLDSRAAARSSSPAFMTRVPRLSLARLVAQVPLVLLLLGGMVVGATHHHADNGDADHCAICVHAHTPATSVAALPSAPAPVGTSERLLPFTVQAPVARAFRAPASRGPPSA